MKPKILWKYTSLERIDSAITGLVRFTQPEDLNDPFDANPQIDNLVTKNQFQKMIKNTSLSRKEFNDIILETLNKGLIDPNNVNDSYKDFIYETFQRGELNFDQSAEVKAIFNMIPSAFSEAINKNIGIFCLSETNDNILMWSHYADQHKGIAIGYDSEHPFFNQQKQGLDFKLGKVKYSMKRPDKPGEFKDNYRLFYQKSPDWKYEKEWRVISRLENADTILSQNDSNAFSIYLFKIPIEAIQYIIFGMKVSLLDRIPAQMKIIEDTLIPRIQINAFPIRFFQAVKHPTLFKVNIEEIK